LRGCHGADSSLVVPPRQHAIAGCRLTPV
jgi:hypothetical protein